MKLPNNTAEQAHKLVSGAGAPAGAGPLPAVGGGLPQAPLDASAVSAPEAQGESSKGFFSSWFGGDSQPKVGWQHQMHQCDLTLACIRSINLT